MENKSLTFKYSSLTISVNPNINKNNLYLEIPINTSSNKYSLNASFLFDVIFLIRSSDKNAGDFTAVFSIETLSE